MRNGRSGISGFVAVLVIAAAMHGGSVARAGMVITEWMYSGYNGEFVEFTNVGSTPIDMTGWSYTDNTRVYGNVSLSAFGIVQPGESVILTETATATFRAAWNLSSSVKIIGGNTKDNLGRSDEINLCDASLNLVDRLTFNDQAGAGPRTQYRSCNIPAEDYNVTTAKSSWPLASVGDAYGSWLSAGGDIGSPGRVPEPSVVLLLAAGGLLAGWRRTRA